MPLNAWRAWLWGILVSDKIKDQEHDPDSCHLRSTLLVVRSDGVMANHHILGPFG